MSDIQDLKTQNECASAAASAGGNSIRDRGKAREDAYFARRDAELVAELKSKKAADKADEDCGDCDRGSCDPESGCCKDLPADDCCGGSCGA